MSRRLIMISVFMGLFILPLIVSAQSQMEDVIYLKDGGILRGEIVERTEDETVKIKITGGNVFAVEWGKVREITREEMLVPKFYKKTGYINQTGTDLLPGRGNSSVRFQMLHGYRFSPVFSTGVGFGFTTYNDPLGLIPVYLETKYRLITTNTAPFIFIKVGYNFSVLTDETVEVDRHRGGLLLNPGIGIQFDTSRQFGWYFTAGYNVDSSFYEQEQFGGRVIETDISYRRILFGIGLVF